jgi:hypothetical protein
VAVGQQLLTPGTWTYTGTLNVPRSGHTATLLNTGKVLIAGGVNSATFAPTNSAEIYDPTTGSFTNTGSMLTARNGFTATLLNDGRVLVVGGVSSSGTLASAEIYNPATGRFSSTGNMRVVRHSHGAALLPSGEVLIAGGNNATGIPYSTAELYNPATGAFLYTGSMNKARGEVFQEPSLRLLNTGMVLVYDQETNCVAPCTAEPTTPRGAHGRTRATRITARS